MPANTLLASPPDQASVKQLLVGGQVLLAVYDFIRKKAAELAAWVEQWPRVRLVWLHNDRLFRFRSVPESVWISPIDRSQKVGWPSRGHPEAQGDHVM